MQKFKVMLNDLKESFRKKREESKGSRERMKALADKCVQAYNVAEKHKALGRPSIDPSMAAKKKKSSEAKLKHHGRKNHTLSSLPAHAA